MQEKPCFQHKGCRLNFQVIIVKHSLIPQVKNPPGIALGRNEIWWLLSLHFFFFSEWQFPVLCHPTQQPTFSTVRILAYVAFPVLLSEGLPLFPKYILCISWGSPSNREAASAKHSAVSQKLLWMS